MEKRKYKRFDLSLEARVDFADPSGKRREMWLKTKDICYGGAFFLSQEQLPANTQLNIDVYFPNYQINSASPQSMLTCKGQVVRSESSGLAVSFNSCDMRSLLGDGPIEGFTADKDSYQSRQSR